MNKQSALIIVDLQNDFCVGGIMGAPHDDDFVQRINQLQACFPHIIASQDWHPENHVSFALNHAGCKVGDAINVHGFQQTLWPRHCVQHTQGAELHPALLTERIAKRVYKGVDAEIDSYSAFYDNAHQRSTGLTDYLHSLGVTHVYLTGLLIDYCVKYSALDAVADGFEVTVIQDACCALNLNPQDETSSIAEMKAQGINFIMSGDLER